MNNFFARIFRYISINQLILFGLVLTSGVIAITFWNYNLAVYDSAGHIALVDQIAKNFWPFLSGWNPNELLGWPQGVFYPSLFHWLAATLSFVTGSEVAVRLLIAISILILPASFYFFLETLVKNKFWAVAGASLLFLITLLLPNFLGTGFRSLFQIGLLSNFFALPFTFLFLASLHKNWNYKIPSLLLAFLVLTHIVAAIVAAIYLLLFGLGKWLIGEKFNLSYYLKTFGLALILTSFFWIPFLLNLEFTSVSRHVSSYFWVNAGVFVVSLLFLRNALKRKEHSLFGPISFTSVFALLALMDGVLISWFGTSYLLYPFHIYRFQPFVYLLLAVLVTVEISKFKVWDRLLKDKTVSALLLLGGLVVVALTGVVRNPANISQASFEVTNEKAVAGRFIETFRRSDVDPFWYGFQEETTQSQNSDWAYGLFTDSSPNGPYLGSLIKSQNPEIYGSDEEIFIETRSVDGEKAESILDYFGINYILRLDDQEKQSVGTLTEGTEKYYYNAEKISNSPIFEVVNIRLEPVANDWDKAVEEWWFASGSIESIPVKINNIPESPTQGNVELIESNEKDTRFKLQIDSEEPVPILAKISYFPYWQATSNEQKIQIYQAAPNLMIFFANGEVTLEYKTPTWINSLYLISLATLLAVLFQLLRKKFI